MAKKSPEEMQAMREKYPSMPDYALPTTKNDRSPANQLQADIMAYVKRIGGYAFRVNTMGIYSQKLKKYIPSGATLGVSDVLICLNGMLYCCEVKIGRDKIRPDQEKFRDGITAAKGKYFIATSLEDFKTKFNQLI